jgi:hypothetical protein
VTVARIFLAYAIVVGLAVGGIFAFVPQSRTIGVAPFFWVMIAFAVFEGIAHVRGTSVGPPITMPTRLIGLAIALAMVVLVPLGAGAPINLF